MKRASTRGGEALSAEIHYNGAVLIVQVSAAEFPDSPSFLTQMIDVSRGMWYNRYHLVFFDPCPPERKEDHTMLHMKKLLACVLALALFTTGCGLAALADTLSLPAALARIETEAFRGNTSLTDIVIPDNCAEIGPFAFADCANLRTALIPEGVTQISDTAFDGCGGLTILGWTGSCAERFALANGIPFFPYDPADADESDPWYLSGEMSTAEGDSGTVHLTWEGNGTAHSYGVYEIIDGIEVLRGIYEDTEATLYGVGSGEHSYAVRPLKVSDGIPVPGLLSKTLTVDMTEGAEPPEMTYADESSDQEVTLRWSGEAESFDILEQGADGSMTVIMTVHGNEAVLGDVAPGAHSYFIRANTLGGASAISACREIYVYGAQTVSLDTDSISIYPSQLSTLTATVSPVNTDSAKLTWTSSDPAVAKVAEDGTVTGVAPGNAMITCTLENGHAASCEVTVIEGETVKRDDFTVVGGVLTGYEGTVKNLAIPDDLGIWKIGAKAFDHNSDIQSIVIPKGVTEIGDHAFYYCRSLSHIEIPDGVTTIGAYAFSNCIMPEINLPDSITTIGDYAFQWCMKLEQINIPDGVTTLGSYAFYRCTNLSQIDIPGSLAAIGDYCFNYCGLTNVTIRPGVTVIGSHAFDNCKALEEIDIAESVNEIKDHTFSHCEALKHIELPRSITTISAGLFEYCLSLTNCDIPDGVTSINAGTFSNCVALEHIDFPSSVTYIGGSAFAKCDSLTAVTIPKTVATIGSSAFSSCGSLTEVSIPGGIKITDINGTIFPYCNKLSHVCFTNDFNVNALEAFPLGIPCPFDITFEEGVTFINKQAFCNMTTLRSVVLPDGLTSINEGVFGGCSSLVSVTIPDSVKSIGKNAFAGCSSLLEIKIPDGVTTISWRAFYNCSQLTRIDLPDSVESFEFGAFSGCTSLVRIDLPKHLTLIDNASFSNCTSLKRIVIPDSVNEIGSGAFGECSSLVEAILPKSLKLLDEVFRNCTSLTYIDVPEKAVNIYPSAFANCTSLTTVVIRGAETAIYSNAFIGCNNPTFYGVPGGKTETFTYYNNFLFRPLEEYTPPATTDDGDVPITDESGAVLMCTGMALNTEAIFGRTDLLSASETSSDDSVVFIDSGVATALEKGSATLTAILTPSGKTVTRTVIVLGGFTQTKMALPEGDEAVLAWDPIPGYTPGEPYHHTDALGLGDAVSVDADGHITALSYKLGWPDHIRMDMGRRLYTQCDVYVLRSPTSVKLEPSELILPVKETQTLTASVGPNEYCRQYTFTSADPGIAKVDDSGVVTGVSVGLTTIEVMTHNGVTNQCKVRVVPEGFDEQVLQGYLANIRTQCRALINMSRIFDGGYYRADGTHVDGIDPVYMTNLVQDIYASILGSNADTVFSREVRALTLADAIMRSIATKSEQKWFTIDEIVDALGNINDFSDFAKCMAKLLSVLGNETGYISVDLSDYKDKGGFLGFYSKNNLFSNSDFEVLEYFSVAEDAGKVVESFLTAWRKFKLYMSADQKKLNQYIEALELSDDDDVRAAATLLWAFKAENEELCLMSLLGLHGFVKGEKMTVKYVWKFAKDTTSKALPGVGLLLAGVKVGKISNSFLFNLNSVQRNVYRAKYVIKAVNGYRSVFEDALNAFTRDPLDPEKFRLFTEAELAFSRLVCEEYKAYGAIPDAMAKGGYAWIYNLKHDGTLKGTASSCESAGDQALTLAKACIASYGKEVLGISE